MINVVNYYMIMDRWIPINLCIDANRWRTRGWGVDINLAISGKLSENLLITLYNSYRYSSNLYDPSLFKKLSSANLRKRPKTSWTLPLNLKWTKNLLTQTCKLFINNFKLKFLLKNQTISGVLMGITNMAATIPGFLVPALVGILTHGKVNKIPPVTSFFLLVTS